MVPTVKPSLSPTHGEQFDPTEEPSEHPSSLPTRRPSFFPSQPPTHLPTNIPEIAAVSAKFNSNWLSIAVVFDVATNQPGAPESFDCGDLITADTVKLLGEGSRCEWKSKVELIIYTGYMAEILYNQNMTFKPIEKCIWGSICTEYNDYPMKQKNITILAADDITQVEASLIGPAAIGLCQDLAIHLTASGSAGRDIAIVWTIPEVFSSSSYCDITTENVLTLLVDWNCINQTDLKDGVLNFTVTVKNWLESTDTEVFEVFYEKSFIPEVAFRGPFSISAHPLETVEVVIDVFLPECTSSTAYDWEFFWDQKMGNNTPDKFEWDELSYNDINMHELSLSFGAMRKNLVIPARTIQYDSYYVFQVRVTGEDVENDYNFIGIKSDRRPMPKIIEIVEEQPTCTDQVLEISARDLFEWSDIREASD